MRDRDDWSPAFNLYSLPWTATTTAPIAPPTAYPPAWASDLAISSRTTTPAATTTTVGATCKRLTRPGAPGVLPGPDRSRDPSSGTIHRVRDPWDPRVRQAVGCTIITATTATVTVPATIRTTNPRQRGPPPRPRITTVSSGPAPHPPPISSRDTAPVLWRATPLTTRGPRASKS